MNHQLLALALFLALCGASVIEAYTHTSYNPSNGHNTTQNQLNKLSRAKRVAIFDGVGVSKVVLGVAHPVLQPDKTQSFWWFYVFQGVYTPTTIPIWWWTFWNTSAFVSTAREWRKDLQTTLRDDARTWLYDTIETALEGIDSNNTDTSKGSGCMLRAICEVAQMPFENNNIFSELLNAILVPSVNNVAEKYLNARDAGRGGADCSRNYSSCSKKLWRWLTRVIRDSL